MVTVLHRAGNEEEHAGDETVSDHSEQSGIDTEVGEGRNTEHDESHVSDRGESDQSLHVGLSEASECTIDNADHGKDADHRSPCLCSLRKHRNGDADKTVGAELQKDCGQDD